MVIQENSGLAEETDMSFDADEPMLRETLDRFVLFPIKHDDVWQMYKEHAASFWTAEEIYLDQDKKDWNELKPDEQHFLKHVLAFFASKRCDRQRESCCELLERGDVARGSCVLRLPIMMENIHAETYSLLIDTYIREPMERDKLFNALETVPAVQKKGDWAMRWLSRRRGSFAERLVAFAAVEGIFFSGSFCALFWLKKRGIMPGMTFSNELISRDEGLHCDFACLLHSKLRKPASERAIHRIISEAVTIEKEFVTDALPVRLIGMNAEQMCQYIEFVADRLLDSLGATKLYGATNPFPWMETISMQGKTNFFEKRGGVSEGERDRHSGQRFGPVALLPWGRLLNRARTKEVASRSGAT